MSSGSERYFCHECVRDTDIIRAPDIRCMRCNGTFVEELPPDSGVNPENDPRHWAGPDEADWDHDGPFGNPTRQLMQLLNMGLRAASGPGAHPEVAGPPDLGSGGQDDHAEPSYRRHSDPVVGETERPNNLRASSGGILGAFFGLPPRDAQERRGTSRAATSPGQTRTYTGRLEGGRSTFSFTLGGGGGAGGSPMTEEPESLSDPRTRPVVTLTNFISEAFGIRPLDPPDVTRRPSDPPTNRNRGPDDEQIPYDYLMSMLHILGHDGRLGGQHMAGHGGNYVFDERGMTDIISELMQQAEGRGMPPPASEDAVSKLKRFRITKEMLNAETVSDCAVCKEEFKTDDDCLMMPCHHIFHAEDCLLPWLRRNGTCPNCRYSIVSPNAVDDPVEALPGPGQQQSSGRPSFASFFRRASSGPQRQTSTSSGPVQSPNGVNIAGSRLPGGFPGLSEEPNDAFMEDEQQAPRSTQGEASGSGARHMDEDWEADWTSEDEDGDCRMREEHEGTRKGGQAERRHTTDEEHLSPRERAVRAAERRTARMRAQAELDLD